MTPQQSVRESEPNVAAIRLALETATNLMYLARESRSRDEADIYLENAETVLKAITGRLGGISSEKPAVS